MTLHERPNLYPEGLDACVNLIIHTTQRSADSLTDSDTGHT